MVEERVRRKKERKKKKKELVWRGTKKMNRRGRKGRLRIRSISTAGKLCHEAPDNKYLRVYSPLASI